MTNCDKSEAFFEAMTTFEIYSSIESKYWLPDSAVTAEAHSHAVRRKAESKTKLYNLLMGE